MVDDVSMRLVRLRRHEPAPRAREQATLAIPHADGGVQAPRAPRELALEPRGVVLWQVGHHERADVLRHTWQGLLFVAQESPEQHRDEHAREPGQAQRTEDLNLQAMSHTSSSGRSSRSVNT